MKGSMDAWMIDGWMDDGWKTGRMDEWMKDGWWMEEGKDGWMRDGTNGWATTLGTDPFSPEQLTIDPQAVLQLCAAHHIGCHTAVAPSIRKLGLLNEKNSPISWHHRSVPGRDRLAALKPGDIWGREERCKGPCQPFRVCLCPVHPRGGLPGCPYGATLFQALEKAWKEDRWEQNTAVVWDGIKGREGHRLEQPGSRTVKASLAPSHLTPARRPPTRQIFKREYSTPQNSRLIIMDQLWIDTWTPGS